jgi:hypothetical protein
MRRLTIFSDSKIKDIEYKIKDDSVTIISNGLSPTIILDNFFKNYYSKFNKIPLFDKYIIESGKSIIVYNREQFYNKLSSQTLGSLLKLGLIEWKIKI